jgi:hypothetical protein
MAAQMAAFDELHELESINAIKMGDVKRFDSKFTMYNRVRWDSKVMEIARKIKTERR